MFALTSKTTPCCQRQGAWPRVWRTLVPSTASPTQPCGTVCIRLLCQTGISAAVTTDKSILHHQTCILDRACGASACFGKQMLYLFASAKDGGPGSSLVAAGSRLDFLCCDLRSACCIPYKRLRSCCNLQAQQTLSNNNTNAVWCKRCGQPKIPSQITAMTKMCLHVIQDA